MCWFQLALSSGVGTTQSTECSYLPRTAGAQECWGLPDLVWEGLQLGERVSPVMCDWLSPGPAERANRKCSLRCGMSGFFYDLELSGSAEFLCAGRKAGQTSLRFLRNYTWLGSPFSDLSTVFAWFLFPCTMLTSSNEKWFGWVRHWAWMCQEIHGCFQMLQTMHCGELPNLSAFLFRSKIPRDFTPNGISV